jgi:hypothetical protein
MFKVHDEIEDKVSLYQTTEEGVLLWDMLAKIDKCCSNWMNAFEYRKMKKELFVQLYEFYNSEEKS